MKLKNSLWGVLTFCLVNSLNSLSFACKYAEADKTYLTTDISHPTCVQRINDIVAGYNLVVRSKSATSIIADTIDNETAVMLQCLAHAGVVSMNVIIISFNQSSSTLNSVVENMTDYIKTGR